MATSDLLQKWEAIDPGFLALKGTAFVALLVAIVVLIIALKVIR